MKWFGLGVIAFNIFATVVNVAAGSYLIAAVCAAAASVCCFIAYQNHQLEDR